MVASRDIPGGVAEDDGELGRVEPLEGHGVKQLLDSGLQALLEHPRRFRTKDVREERLAALYNVPAVAKEARVGQVTARAGKGWPADPGRRAHAKRCGKASGSHRNTTARRLEETDGQGGVTARPAQNASPGLRDAAEGQVARGRYRWLWR